MVTTGYPICSVKVFIILPTSIVFPAALFAFEKERANWIISYRKIIIIFCQRIYDVQRVIKTHYAGVPQSTNTSWNFKVKTVLSLLQIHLVVLHSAKDDEQAKQTRWQVTRANV